TLKNHWPRLLWQGPLASGWGDLRTLSASITGVMNRTAVAATGISPVIHSYADAALVLRCRRSETETASSHGCLHPACCLRSMSRRLDPPCGAPRSIRDRARNVPFASSCPSDEKVRKSSQLCSLRFRFRYP